MKKVIIASKNPVKIGAVEQGFALVFPEEKFEFESVAVSSGVPDQPIGNMETFQGAKNRAQRAAQEISGADFYVGIEGGIIPLINDREQDSLDSADDMQTSAWIVIISGDLIGKARTAGFFLPPEIRDLVKQGKELGEAGDIIFKENNIKQKNGTIGILTGDLISRTAHYTSAVILALIPFKNPDLYKD